MTRSTMKFLPNQPSLDVMNKLMSHSLFSMPTWLRLCLVAPLCVALWLVVAWALEVLP
jgi:hypothetical protein